MKLIISSQSLHEQIQKAFDRNCERIEYDPDLCSLFFYCDGGRISIPAKEKNNHNLIVKFNHLPMARLMLFLKTIPHQPILILLEDDNIEIQSCIIKF